MAGNTTIFTGVKAAIFTWDGCSFEVSGDALQSEYTAEETPMFEYIGVHFALEALRTEARRLGREGPRVLLLGPDDAGKSSLAKTLTGYAQKQAWSPVVVDLDIKEGSMSIPGTMTATVFNTLMDVEEGWGAAPMSGPNGTIPVKLPLVYFFGSSNPHENEGKVYKAQISRLALAVAGRTAQDPEVKYSGVIIDTPGSLVSTNSNNTDNEIIHEIVSEFAVSGIICMGSERLYSDMVKRYNDQPIAPGKGTSHTQTVRVIKVPKSGGCVNRDETYMQSLRASQIRRYFYNNPHLSNGISLQPRQQQVDFSTLTIWRRVSSTPDPSSTSGGGAFGNDDDNDSFLPGGLDDDSTPALPGLGSKVALPASQIYERMTAPVAAMGGSILAVLNCDPEADQGAIRDASVMGFLYVTDTDEARGRISLLSPVAGRVPNRAIVWAGWPEGVLGMDRL